MKLLYQVICYDYTTPVVDERVWGIAEMIETGEYRSTWRKICPITTFSTTNPTPPGPRGGWRLNAS